MSQAGDVTIPGRRRVARRRELKTEREGPEQTHGLRPDYDQGAAEAGQAGTGPRQDGSLTAVLPGGGRRQEAGHGVPAVSGVGAR